MALFNGLAKALLRYEQIVTTLPKAKDLRPYVEKMITLGKKPSVAHRRDLFAKLRDNSLVSKVFGPLAERYMSRNGGYTRIVKCGFRSGDAAPIAVIELLDRDESAKQGAGAAAAASKAE
jgi:large subunit ribosomal protein L17